MMITNTEQISDRQAFVEYELPEEWDILPLGHCVDILDNLRIPINSEERKTRQGSIPYYGATGQVGWIDDFLFNEELLLLGEDGAPFLDKPKTVAYIIEGKSWVNNHAHVLRAIKGLTTNKFLKYYLNRFDFSDFVTGTTRLKLTQGAMKKIPVTVPPLPEQGRIVAKVEELLERVSAAKDRLAKVSMILKRFRRAVLAAACSGRLTTDWREKQSYIQHAKDLLLSILAERRQFMQESNPKKRGAPESLHPYREAWDVDPSEFEELPDGWVWASGEDLFAWSSGDFLPKKKQEKGPYPIYGGNGITGYHSEYLVDHPTLVIGRVGALCGNVYITSDKAWITDNAIYASYVPTKLNLQYVKMVFTQSNLNANAGGSGQPFVNQTVLNKVAFPLPPLAEQHEIVRRVESMFKLADAVEKRVAAAKVRSEKLTQAILAKAFRGELVPTEAELARREHRSYETASDLLARIKSGSESK
jgi:type I restriction enzyme S subunit